MVKAALLTGAKTLQSEIPSSLFRQVEKAAEALDLPLAVGPGESG